MEVLDRDDVDSSSDLEVPLPPGFGVELAMGWKGDGAELSMARKRRSARESRWKSLRERRWKMVAVARLEEKKCN